jgi:hypothetical protein
LVGDHPSAGSRAVEESGDRLAERARRYPLDVRAGSDAAKGGTDVVPVAKAAHGVAEHWPIRSPDLLAPGYEHRYEPAGEHEDPRDARDFGREATRPLPLTRMTVRSTRREPRSGSRSREEVLTLDPDEADSLEDLLVNTGTVHYDIERRVLMFGVTPAGS